VGQLAITLASPAADRYNHLPASYGWCDAKVALLVRTLVELADSLVDDFDVVELLTLLSDRCVETIDVASAGVMLAAPSGTSKSLLPRVKPCVPLSCSSCKPIRTVPRLLPHRKPIVKFGSRHRRQSLAAVSPLEPSMPGCTRCTPCDCASEAGPSARSTCSAQITAPSTRTTWPPPKPRRCRDHRHPPTPNRRGRPDPQHPAEQCP